MLTRLMAGLVGAAFWLGSHGASAIEIFVDPATQVVNVGDTVTVDVNIRGLGVGSAPSVGFYDLDIGFDTSLLSFDDTDPTAVVFGTELDPFGFGVNPRGVAGTGPVNVFELSLDFPADLNALQADSFTMFSLTFEAHAVGTSAVTLGLFALSDAVGSPLVSGLLDGEIVIEALTAAPEPAPIALLAVGLLALTIARRRRAA